MASLVRIKNQRGKSSWRIEFFLNSDPQRKHIYLGKVDKRQAEATKARIELLIAAKVTGTAPDLDTSRWVAERDDVLHAKLVQFCLVAERDCIDITTVGEFLDCYIAKRTDVKPGTKVVYGHTRRCLVEYFGKEKSLAKLTIADARD